MPVYQISPTKWTNKPPYEPKARSGLACPYVISDCMDPVEQVDGKFYSSKAKFRAVGRALGLTEVGNSKFPPHRRSTDRRETKAARMATLQKAIAQYKQGRRPQKG